MSFISVFYFLFEYSSTLENARKIDTYSNLLRLINYLYL